MTDPWTPGPWTVEGWDNAAFMSTYGVKAPDGRVLLACCNCEDAPTPTDADLRLIAAAPEMAELLERFAEPYALPSVQLIRDCLALLARIRGEAG